MAARNWSIATQGTNVSLQFPGGVPYTMPTTEAQQLGTALIQACSSSSVVATAPSGKPTSKGKGRGRKPTH